MRRFVVALGVLAFWTGVSVHAVAKDALRETPAPTRPGLPGTAAPEGMEAISRSIPDYVEGRAAKDDANANTVGVAGGLLEGSFIRYAADIAKALDESNKLRVIPMVTFGAVGNVTDLLSLKGVDAAITQSDALAYFRDVMKVPNIADRVQYISTLYNAEVHIYAREEFKSLKDLQGKKVAFNTPGSAANLTGQIVFERLGVKVEPMLVNNAGAIEQMRSGEISAVVHVVGKPNELFARFKPEPGFHFLPVPYDRVFHDLYIPAKIEAADYPNLMGAGEAVDTISVPTVLAVYNWPKDSDRYRRVERFINAYFEKFETLKQPGYQPKWKTISLSTTVPGWTRYAVAEEALKRSLARAEGGQDRMRSEFAAFLADQAGPGKAAPRLTDEQQEALFKRFLEWRRSR